MPVSYTHLDVYKRQLQTCLLIIAIAYAALLVLWIAVGKDGPIAVQVEVPKGGVAKVYKSKYVWLISIAYACCVCGTMLINTYICLLYTSRVLSIAFCAAAITSSRLAPIAALARCV